MNYRVLLILFLTLSYITTVGQSGKTESLNFNFYEIHVFSGLTKNGSHSIKLDNNGLLLTKVSGPEGLNVTTELVNFRELNGEDKEEFRKSIAELLEYIEEFNYRNYKATIEKVEIRIQGGDTVTKEFINPSSDLGTRILIIDNNFKSYLIRYYYCEEAPDILVEKVNRLIPRKIRADYEMRKRCK